MPKGFQIKTFCKFILNSVDIRYIVIYNYKGNIGWCYPILNFEVLRMKRILSIFLAFLMVISTFAVSPSAIAVEREYFNADAEAYSDSWFYYANEGKVYKETNTGESRAYFPVDNAKKIGVSNGFIYILRESGISRYDISKKSEKTLISIEGIERFSLADGIIYYLANGKVSAKSLSSGETKEIADAKDFWLENADKLSYMVDDGYIYTVDLASGEIEKSFNNASYFSEDLTVPSEHKKGSIFGIAPQAVSIKKLREKFPAGKYWNHGSGPNNPNGYTSSPCNHHFGSGCEYNGSCGCNSFNMAIQCMGYAEKCGYDATDSNPRTSGEWKKTSSTSALDNLKAGDIVRYKNDGHSVYVIRVSGDTVTITDCNSDNHCIIRWDATISKSTLRSSFSYVRVAPFDAGYYTVNLNTCGGSCNTASIEVMDDEKYGTLPTPTKEGYDFVGWYTAENGGTKITEDSTVNLDRIKELYAHWEIKTYKIIFDANGGTDAPATQIKKYNESIIISSSAPQRYGYTFEKWNTAPDGSGTAYQKSDRYKEDSNLTLYAQWKAKSVRLTFNYNGATASELGRNVTFGQPYGVLPTPTKNGYDFDGWYVDKNGGGKITESSIVSIAEYHTIYAHWAETQYIISYNGRGDGGLWPENHYKPHFSQGKISETVPTSTGMTFIEWNTKEDGTGTVYHPGDVYNNNEPLYLFAQWDREKYNITYDANGGSGAPSTQIKEYKIDLKLSSTRPYKAGYTFMGWSDGKGTVYKPSEVYTKNQPASLSAKWTANTYTVVFDYLEGSYEARQKAVTYDSTYGTLPESSKAGYNFLGWYTEIDGGVKINSADRVKITSDIILYARWERKIYDVAFASDGTNVPEMQKKSHGNDLKLTEKIPTNEGYDFVEWNTSADGTGLGFASGGIYYKDEPITLYAIWKTAEYTVSYDANGGSNAPEQQTKLYGESIAISADAPERDGYNFVGWSASKNGGIDYSSGAAYSANESIMLYAKWEAKQFNAILHYNDLTQTKSLTYGEEYGELMTPEKEGYTFIGWADSEGKTVKPNTVFGGNEDVDLYASWLKNSDLASDDTFCAAFVDNGRVVGKVYYTAETQSIQEPVLADVYGYYAEWENYTLEEGGIVVFSKRTPIVYTAKFIINDETVSTVNYTVEDFKLDEPEIPETEGFTARWSDYHLGGNIEIKAIYTAIEYDAKFVAKGEVISKVKYTIGAKSIPAPRTPVREGYTGRWEEYSVVAGGITINAIYTMNRYNAYFVAEGEEIGTSGFTIDSEKIYEPEVPNKNGYTGVWEPYSFRGNDITVNAVYTPNDYYVTFIADSSEVARVKYTYGATRIEIPDVPQKAGYTAEWGNVNLGYGNSTVYAIYTPIVYIATFVADGVVLGREEFTVRTTALHPPVAPEKDGYNVHWQKYTIEARNMTIEAVYTLYQKINIRGFKHEIHLDYKSTVIFTAEPVGMTDECEIRWFRNGKYEASGDSFEVYRATENYTVQAKIIDKESGEILAESKTEKVYIKDSLFGKFIAFFKMLFNALPVIKQ